MYTTVTLHRRKKMFFQSIKQSQNSCNICAPSQSWFLQEVTITGGYFSVTKKLSLKLKGKNGNGNGNRIRGTGILYWGILTIANLQKRECLKSGTFKIKTSFVVILINELKSGLFRTFKKDLALSIDTFRFLSLFQVDTFRAQEGSETNKLLWQH